MHLVDSRKPRCKSFISLFTIIIDRLSGQPIIFQHFPETTVQPSSIAQNLYPSSNKTSFPQKTSYGLRGTHAFRSPQLSLLQTPPLRPLEDDPHSTGLDHSALFHNNNYRPAYVDHKRLFVRRSLIADINPARLIEKTYDNKGRPDQVDTFETNYVPSDFKLNKDFVRYLELK
jgi:hypothetical protein